MTKLAIYACGLFGLAFAIAGAFLLYTQVLRGRKQTEAEILGVTIESFQTQDEGQTYTAYRARYELRYQVEGRSFQVPLHGNLASHTPDEALLKSHNNPVGSRRPIYYLPARPDDFVLDPLGRRFGFALLLLSLGLSIVAGSALMWSQAQPLDW